MAIERRYRRYFVSLNVPPDVQAKLGRKRFRKALDTDSRAVAERRAPVVIAQWKAEIEQARGNGDDDVAYFRRALEAAYKPEDREAVERLVEQTWAEKGSPAYVHAPGIEPIEDGRAQAAQEAADRWRKQVEAVRLEEHLEAWAEQCDLAQVTRHIALSKLSRFVKAFPTAEDCTREKAQAYVNKLSERISSGTIRNDLGFIRSFWAFLVRQGLAEGEPFDKLELPKKRRNGKKREPFTHAHIRMLYDRAVDRPLQDLIIIASHTGCRIGELGAVKVEDVRDGCIHITAGKSEAAIRAIPIHKAIQDTVDRLIAESTDGYLLSGQSQDQFGNRSGGLRNKFGRLKNKLGFGPEHNFHSIRRFVSTCLHEAGIPEPIAADILGHEIPYMSYGVYAGAASIKAKREALETAIELI